jgi:hypothetical protein
LPHHPEVKGLSPATGAGTRREKMPEKGADLDTMTILIKTLLKMTLLITLINAALLVMELTI